MPTLRETLLAPDIKPHVIADCEDLVDREVAEMSGVTGAAVRLAYKTVRAFDAGHIPAMIESILPSVAGALQPYWAGFTAECPGGGDFGGYLAGREDEVAEALLAITDSRRRASSRAAIVKAYNTVRGSAVKPVKAALPALGALVQCYSRGDDAVTAGGTTPLHPPIMGGGYAPHTPRGEVGAKNAPPPHTVAEVKAPWLR